VPSKKRTLILGYVGASASAEDSNFGLNVLNVIVAGFKINLAQMKMLVEGALFDPEKAAAWSAE
jgi:hypothetical protein